MPQRSPAPVIAVLLGTELAYQRRALRGIARYARIHTEWIIESEPSKNFYRHEPRQTFEAALKTDGVIAFVTERAQLAMLQKRRVPFVSMSSLILTPEMMHAGNDEALVGKLAAEHLLERGFRNVAYCELDESSHFRRQHFVASAEAVGLACHVYRVGSSRHNDWIRRRDRKRLANWLSSLPKPVGILAHNDLRARHLTDVCRNEGIPVPDDVAILGVDNDVSHCELSSPPISSVETDSVSVGYYAARLLHQSLEGHEPAERHVHVSPKGVATRQSTDVQATADPLVGRAVSYIREHATDGIKVGDVLRHVVVSRTTLDNAFSHVLGRTAHEEINRVRLNRARELLLETRLTLDEVARRSGFGYGEYLGVVFLKHFGQTPGGFRKANRAGM